MLTVRKSRITIPKGKSFGRLTFVKEAPDREGTQGMVRYGVFDCICGNRAEIRIKSVLYRQQESCGCKTVDNNKSRFEELPEEAHLPRKQCTICKEHKLFRKFPYRDKTRTKQKNQCSACINLQVAKKRKPVKVKQQWERDYTPVWEDEALVSKLGDRIWDYIGSPVSVPLSQLYR